ncbi:MAG: hypothetical protein HYX53_00655 [Chloroflexi bacterium]|nr:hypothetical protein [Chloroflexota bacterium]
MSSDAAAASFTLWWTRLYTSGLQPCLRDERRDEIASDIFEHRHAAATSGPMLALAIALRCLLGIPADLAWRVEHSAVAGMPARLLLAALGRIENTARWVNRRGLPGLTMLLAGLYLLGGALVILTLPMNNNPDLRGVFVFGAWCMLAGGLILLGSRLTSRRPWRGLALLLGGAVPLGAMLFATVIIPMATAVVAWHAVARSRAATRQRGIAG